jgi:hypothetical protein
MNPYRQKTVIQDYCIGLQLRAGCESLRLLANQGAKEVGVSFALLSFVVLL